MGLVPRLVLLILIDATLESGFNNMALVGEELKTKTSCNLSYLRSQVSPATWVLGFGSVQKRPCGFDSLLLSGSLGFCKLPWETLETQRR